MITGLSRCDKCLKTCDPKQAMRFIWKKKGVTLDLCPRCFGEIYSKHLKEVEMSKTSMVKSGYYEQGAREVDFKSYLEKWAKQFKQTL